ncbi:MULTISPECIES: uroporphyrinogen-III synthase [Metallosphaera]|uniref:uroporphyrinogen-III synthase n=1 Tax=Metallosphaera TaxID=41980 RepID=UPI001F066CD7|nr:uroporphyrinogen-III synthase [Metallosphaera sedula]MCH1770977.1 uroporphyrinogen-III synthase [Metallosphaera sedula]MCP6729334.1 uroporphyrinogen-III synthase [Metallosphaera sedula]
MRVLYLRPEGSSLPELPGFSILNVSIFSVKCLEYDNSYLKSDGVAFTSVNAVRCFKDFDSIRGKSIFSIGPGTAEELRKHGFESTYPERYTSKDLALLILRSGVREVSAFRSLKASDDMRRILVSILYHEVYDYDLILDQEKLNQVKELLTTCSVDVVVLTSSLIAKSVANFIRDCHKVVTIGPMTSTSLKTLRPDLSFTESDESTIDGTVKVLKSLKGGERDG